MPAYACCAPVAAAAVVTNLDDSGAGSLRQAIAAANAGDTVEFAPGLSGTILLGSTLALQKNVTINGNFGIVLDGNDSVPVLSVPAGVQVNLDRLVIQRGLGVDGGGIASAGTLSLTDCEIRDSHATNNGGGIFIGNGAGSSYSLVNTTVSDNDAMAEGGGIYDSGTNASSITASRIIGNVSSGRGGGIRHLSGQTLAISHSMISGNQALGGVYGGGISSTDSPLDVSYSTISANKAGLGGGIAIFNLAQPATGHVTASLVLGNTAILDGGGIIVRGATVDILNTTIAYNLATHTFPGEGGGGVYTQNTGFAAATSLTNSTIAFNSAVQNGGGIVRITGGLTLRNTLIANNGAATNTDIDAAFTSLGYNLVRTRGSSTGYDASLDLADGTNPMLGPLAFNGGPTDTIAPQAGSPAIGAIPIGSCVDVTLDQRGYRRFGNSCDIGALEVDGIGDSIFASGFE